MRIFNIVLVLIFFICVDTSYAVLDDATFRSRLAKRDARAALNSFIDLRYAPFDVAATGLMIDHELERVRRVVAARQADTTVYAPEDNPYRIYYSSYNLRHPDLLNELVGAHQKGVIVQLLIEDKKLDNSPGNEHNYADEVVAAGGISVFNDIRDLSDEERKQSFMAGVYISGRGLFHTKLREFYYISETDGTPVVEMQTGSLNPGDNAMNNDESCIEVRDTSLREQYAAFSASVRAGNHIDVYTENPEWDDTAAVNLVFAPGKNGGADHAIATHIFDWIDAEKQLIILTVFSLRNFNTPYHQQTLIESLASAVQRGVLCLVVTDRKQAVEHVSVPLEEAGCLVYEALNDVGPYNAMHVKDAYFGVTDTKVVTDTTNWSENALGSCVNFRRKQQQYVKGGCDRASSVESALFIQTALLDDEFETQRRALHHALLLLTRYQRQQPSSSHSPIVAYSALLGKFGESLPFYRTVIYVQKSTQLGEFVWLHGQVCDDEACTSLSDARIRYVNYQNTDTLRLKQSLDLLTWEDDAALDWTCNRTVHEQRAYATTYAVDGFGYDEENDELGETLGVTDESGMWWKFDVLVDARLGAWIQFKAVLRNADNTQLDWEPAIANPSQGDAVSKPPASSNDGNHWARVGFVTRVRWGESAADMQEHVRIVPNAANDGFDFNQLRESASPCIEDIDDKMETPLTDNALLMAVAAVAVVFGFGCVLSSACAVWLWTRSRRVLKENANHARLDDVTY